MDMRFDFEKERKQFLNLTECDTKRIYTKILETYKQNVIHAPRKVVGYAIDIVLCNMNGYNRLGKLQDLNNTWGDNNFYVDLNNSIFLELMVNSLGYIETGFGGLSFKDIAELKKNIGNISLSIKEIIDLCKEDDFAISICARDDDTETTIEIEPYKKFNMNESIKKYLETLK